MPEQPQHTDLDQQPTETCRATTIGMFGRLHGPCIKVEHSNETFHRDAHGNEWRNYTQATPICIHSIDRVGECPCPPSCTCCTVATQPRPEYPYDDRDVTVLGPEVFTSKGGAVISWRGENYVRQQDVEPSHGELITGALHEIASTLRDLTSAIRLENADRSNAASTAEQCCVCGGGEATYLNYQLQPFCGSCANCTCGQNPCVRTGVNARTQSSDAAARTTPGTSTPSVGTTGDLWEKLVAAVEACGIESPFTCGEIADAVLDTLKEHLDLGDAEAWCKSCRRVWESKHHRCESDAEILIARIRDIANTWFMEGEPGPTRNAGKHLLRALDTPITTRDTEDAQ